MAASAAISGNGRSFAPVLLRVVSVVMLALLVITALPLALPRVMGYESYNVVSGSMAPEIPVGSLLYVERNNPAQVADGDVIAFIPPTESALAARQAAQESAYDDDSSSYLNGAATAEGGNSTAGTVIAHRVVTNKTVEGEFVTKGDANAEADMLPVNYSDYVGQVVLSLPFFGNLQALYGNAVGTVYAVLFAVAAILMWILADRMQKQ